MKKSVWIHDIESFSNFFSYYAIDIKTGKEVFFYIHNNINQLQELLTHLREEVSIHIGFNNINYDYPILHRLLTDNKQYNAEDIYQISQEVITSDYTVIWNELITQVDVYKIKHYDNKAKSTSLKWLEFTQRWYKLQDLPFNHYDIINEKDVESIKLYNRNDVLATKMFYEKHCKKDINFRKSLNKKLGINTINFNDVKIGEYLNKKTYIQLSKRDWKEFKDKRTYHKIYKLKDIVEDKIQFKTKYLQNFLINLKSKSFQSEDDKTIDAYLKFAGCTFKFAKGGLHSEDSPRIEQPTNNQILVEKDVSSYYPKSIVNSKLYPNHLGIEWYNAIAQMYNRRANEIKPLMKTLDKSSIEYQELDAEQASIKLSMNGGAFGKLGSSYSWQYDPLQKYRITINCELKLLMLIEEFDLAGIRIVSANTDGVVINYDKSKQYTVDKIHKNWEDKFNYILEDTYYSRIIFSSVNDYLAEIIDNKTGKVLYHKFKGELVAPFNSNVRVNIG